MVKIPAMVPTNGWQAVVSHRLSTLLGFDMVKWPRAMNDPRRMTLAEFTRVHCQSRVTSPDEPERDVPAPEPPNDEDKLAAQVVMAILKSRE